MQKYFKFQEYKGEFNVVMFFLTQVEMITCVKKLVH